MKLHVVVALAMLGGCAASVPFRPAHWDKPGGTAESFRRDRGYCIAQSGAVPVVEQGSVFSGCMQGKGWIDTPG